jgi:beta-xylosidase
MSGHVSKVWADDTAIYIETADGKVYNEQFADYPRLRCATREQRTKFEYDNIGIRWEELDEDLCYEGFLLSMNRRTYRR